MCKWMAGVLWVVGGVGSIWLGKALEIEDLYGDESYNWGACLAGLISIIICGTLIWGLGEIVDKMAEKNECLRRLIFLMESDRKQKGEWECPDCHTINKVSQVTCSICGRYRA